MVVTITITITLLVLTSKRPYTVEAVVSYEDEKYGNIPVTLESLIL